MDRIFYVSPAGRQYAAGHKDDPFRTISEAAHTATAGDTIIVHGGTYREWVNPAHGGTNESSRITYIAAEDEHVTLKGSEIIKGWERFKGTVWKKEIGNSFFNGYNPFATRLYGDWFIWPLDYDLHTGDVFLNGRSMFEARSLDDVLSPVERKTGMAPPWSSKTECIPAPETTVYVWWADCNDTTTVIYANFQDADPNEELVEISVRPFCFFPTQTGIDYITVSGFEIAQAATQWAPPTAFQPGLIGPHWSKGWIIENCDIHDSKASGISLGKEISTGHNDATSYGRKPGYQYQFEAVCKALSKGWSKENIGSHVIRNNRIHDCGQNGIVGHMGCIFSEITGNEIYNIGTKHEFFGHEIAGIKLHAAIDVVICGNKISNCTLGTWLDWETQGTRVSSNLYFSNDRDIFVEVSHGPYIIDNNIFASEYSVDNVSQGGAYINNIFAGAMRRESVLDRSTPYHFSHSTELAGSAFVYSGDDRFYNNIFIGGARLFNSRSSCGTISYDGSPSSMEEYTSLTSRDKTRDHDKFFEIKQPAYINSNLYLKGAEPYGQEKNRIASTFDPEMRIDDCGSCAYLEISLPECDMSCRTIKSRELQPPRITECDYEDRDGNGIIFDTDMLGTKCNESRCFGPVEGLHAGKNRIKVWSK